MPINIGSLGEHENVLFLDFGFGDILMSKCRDQDSLYENQLLFSKDKPMKIGAETEKYNGRLSDEIPEVKMVMRFGNPESLTALIHSLVELQETVFKLNSTPNDEVIATQEPMPQGTEAGIITPSDVTDTNVGDRYKFDQEMAESAINSIVLPDSLYNKLHIEAINGKIHITAKGHPTPQPAIQTETWWNKVWDACKSAGMKDHDGSGLEQVIHFLESQKIHTEPPQASKAEPKPSNDDLITYIYNFAWHYGRLYHIGDAEKIKVAISEKFQLPEEFLSSTKSDQDK